MQELTKAEEEVMQYLWKLEKAFVKEVIAEMPEPKPAYNTVSTIVRILENKNYVDHNTFGKTHQYFPVIKKEDYSKKTLNNVMEKHFDGSFSKLVSFFVDKNKMDVKEMDEIMNLINKKKK